MSKSPRSRAWCWTLHNATEAEEKTLSNIECKYICWGREICPKTKREHLQGFTYFNSAKTFNGVKKLFPNRSHIERCAGNAKQNIEYCSKDGKFVEYGDRPNQGKRTDLDLTRERLQDGGTMRGELKVARNLQSVRFAEKWLTYNEPQRNWEVDVQWFYGPTGTGKTKAAKELLPDAYWKANGSKWWDGYDGHEDIIIDDLRAEDFPFNRLLRILDRYPCRIEYKGGYRQLLARNVIITSPKPPGDTYPELVGEDMGQLKRRIRRTVRFSDVNDDGGFS